MGPDTHTQDTIEMCCVVLSAPAFLGMCEEAYPDYNWSYKQL